MLRSRPTSWFQDTTAGMPRWMLSGRPTGHLAAIHESRPGLETRSGLAAFPQSDVQVEVSYREAVVGTPVAFDIGLPFYEPFEILTMEPAEMAAEKLRALAQRLRETDLADLAVLLNDDATNDEAVAKFADTKFELVKQGGANRIQRIERNLGELAETYDNVVPQLFPDAPTYREAADIVWPRIKSLVP